MLAIDQEAIAELVRHHHVELLALFGSATTDCFDPEHSDADFLVEFAPASPSPFDDYFALKETLEAMLGRSVDLSSPAVLENPRRFNQFEIARRASSGRPFGRRCSA